VTVGTVEVLVGKRRKKNKSKFFLKKKSSKECDAEGEVRKKEEKKMEEGKKEEERKQEGLQKVEKEATIDGARPVDNIVLLLYNSKPEDRLWAKGGMVAKVVSGDSSLSLQQRVEDAGFVNVIVTPMGSDRFFCIVRGVMIYGKCLMTLSIFLVHYSRIYINGRLMMIYMKGAPGLEFMALPCMRGMNCF